MLKNYLTVAFRTLKKYKLNTFIHVMGLAIGMACCLLIFLFVQTERSYDRYHSRADDIYRIVRAEQSASGIHYDGNTPYPLAPALRSENDDFEKVARVHFHSDGLVQLENGEKHMENALFAEPALLEIFDIPIVEGAVLEALGQPNQVVLTQRLATKYYGAESPLGKTLRLDNQLDLTVGGVVEDFPNNFHLQEGILVSYESFSTEFMGFNIENWGVTLSGSTYVLLPPNSVVETVNRGLAHLVAKHMPEDRSSLSMTLSLQALKDIHFDTQFPASGATDPINPLYLWVFSLIGFLILLVACINFINLSTAQAIRRAKEIGIRKVVGARRPELINQFLGESFLIVAGALVFAIILAELGLPKLNQLLALQIQFNWLDNPQFLIYLLGFGLIVGLIAGIYPAFVLSGFKPVRAIKGKIVTSQGGRNTLRQGLVALQFGISILLVIGTFVISRQLHYFLNKELGFNQEAIILLDMPERDHFETLRNEWQRDPTIEQVSFALGAPTSQNNIHTGYLPNPADESISYDVAFKPVDANYQKTFGLELLAGRWLTEEDFKKSAPEIPGEEREYAFVVNETLVKQLGYATPLEAINHRIALGVNGMAGNIIGVTRDFHMTSLHEAIDPLIMLHFPRYNYRVGLKLNTSDLPETLAHIETVWNNKFSTYLFKYEFLDESLQQLYESETRLLGLFQLFAGLAIFIACLGLWGLATFVTERRTKEIGVRKVLGASAQHIIVMLSSEFVRLVGIAFVLAAPLAYWGTKEWLQNFPYHITPGIGLFLLAGLLVLLVAWIAVSYHAIRAALSNPIKALRYE